MEEGFGGASGNSCLMAFGDRNQGFSPMFMMMPPIGSSSSCQPNVESGNSCLFFTAPNTNHQDPNRTGNAGSSAMFEGLNAFNNNNNTSTGYYFMDSSNNDDEGSCPVKAKIMAHPHYHRLLAAFVNCQKIGAPPEVVAKLEEACASAAVMGRHVSSSSLGQDPALDQFMEAYCEMLIKYEQELSKPYNEAMLFLSRIESQFKALSVSFPNSAYPEAMDRNNISSEDDVEIMNNNNALIDPQAEDRELKGQLLRKYSGYLGSLKQEFMKKRKKGKLPKEARHQLLEWWSRHYKWPYPSEAQKLALAESTGLDQKQINNWFINQRKRHWKPSEDMQYVVMDSSSSAAAAHQHSSSYYMDNISHVLGNPPFAMDISPALL